MDLSTDINSYAEFFENLESPDQSQLMTLVRDYRDIAAIRRRLRELNDGLVFAQSSEVANWIAYLYRIAMVKEAIKLGNKFLRVRAPTLSSHVDDLITECFGDLKHLNSVIDDWLAQSPSCRDDSATIIPRERKSTYSVLRKAMRDVRKQGSQAAWANLAASIVMQPDLFARQIVVAGSSATEAVVSQHDSHKLDMLQNRLLSREGFSTNVRKAFDREPGLIATRRIQGVLWGELPIEIQLWIAGYFYPMYSYWYFQKKGFAVDCLLDRADQEERVKRFRSIELSGSPPDSLTQELLIELHQRNAN